MLFCSFLSCRRLFAAVLALSASAAAAQSFTSTVADSVSGKATAGQTVTFTVTATSVGNANGQIVLKPQGSALTSAQVAATSAAEKNYVLNNQTVSGGVDLISTGSTTTGDKFTFTPTVTAPATAGSSFGYSVATSYSAVPLTDILVVGPNAPTFTVTTLSDDAYAVPLNCVTGSTAACTLRDAVAAADSYSPGGATVSLAALTGTITLANGQLELSKSVTITGAGADVLTVSGNNASRIFQVDTYITVNISGLTLAKGSVAGSALGGAILNGATLNLTDSTVSNSTAPEAGGGLSNSIGAKATLTRVTMTGNTAPEGGAVYSNGSITLVQCTLSKNNATDGGFGAGGGLYADAYSSSVISNSTFTGNAADVAAGGAIFDTSATISNTIIAGNTAGQETPDLLFYGSYTNGGGNFFGSSSTAGSATTSTSPVLAPLALYGGHTPTMPPLPGSPALCAGLLTNLTAASPTHTDQRGATHSPNYCAQSTYVDSGAVQTSYALAFTTQPAASVANDPVAGPPAVKLTENSLAVTTSQTLPLTLNGTGTLANGSAATSASTGIASYSSASVSSAGMGDTLTSTLTLIPSVIVTATSAAFNVAPQTPGTASTAVASPTTSVSTAGGVSTITVTLLDQNGDPIANATAAGTSTGSGVLSPASTTTNASGQAVFTLTDTVAETVTLHFILAGAPITVAPTVKFTAPPVYTVNSTADSATATTCTATTCRLRDAVAGANAYPGGGASIAFAPALTGTRANPTVITLSGTQLELTAGVTIAGPGADLLQINGGWNGSTSSFSGSGIFQVDAGTTVAISGLTLTRGDGAVISGGGGAISSQGNLLLTDTAITASFGGSGGAIFADNGSLTLTRVTLSGNQGRESGGAMYAGVQTRIVNSTLTGNSLVDNAGEGGAISTSQAVTLIGTTVIGNTVKYGSGGGIFGTAVLLNSIVAGNTANDGADLNTSPTDLGGNLYSTAQSGTSTITPRLAPLGYYDGNGVTAHTMTMPPLPGSPAICAGVAQGSDTTAIPTTDQRGYPSLTFYSGTGCIDSGATTTSYAGTLTAPPSAVSGDPFTSVLTVTEHGNTLTFPVAQATSTPTLTSSPDTLPGYTTDSSTRDGTYPFLATINGTATPDTLTATLPLSATAAGFSTTGTTRTIPSVSLVETASIIVAQPVATTFTATATPSTGVSTSGGVSTVTVKVLDQNGDPIAKQTVAVSTTGSAALSTASVTTNSAGTATVNLSDTTAETTTVTATPTGANTSATANVTFTAPPVFTVTSNADSTTIAACPAGNTASTTCTLRNAIAGANAYPGGGALVNILFTTPTTITLTAGQLEISRSATITGPGANLLTVSGNSASRVLQIDNGVTANISGLTLTRGATDYGAGISNNGTLFLTNAAITASNATTSGGAIYSSGPSLVLAGVTLSGNNAITTGGAVATGGGTITVINSTITGNTAPGSSGQGFQNAGNGGGFFLGAASTLHLQSTTVTNNSATDAGGIAFGSATVTLQNSIVEGNSAQGGADFEIQPTDNGGNLFGVGNTLTTPALATLGYYGGPTQTMPPLPGSPALCAGTLANLTAASANNTDQRGATHSAAYCTSTHADAGAVQTRYTGVAFSTQPTNTATSTAISPAPAIVIAENAFPISGASIPVALSTTGDYAPSGQPTLSGTLTATTSPASFSNLKLNQLAGGLHLVSTVPITSTFSLSVTSAAFDVTNTNGAGSLYSTITDNVSSRPYPGDSVTFVATVTNLGGQTYLPTFTVTLPAGLSNISVAGSTGNDSCFVASATTVTCITFGAPALNFYTGNTISVTIQANVTATDAVGSTIAVTAHATDLNNDAGNTATDTLTVSGITVNTLADDATGTAANCTGAGTCTLRDAVATVNAASGANAIPIVFAASLSGTQAAPNTITLTNGQLELSHPATITGPGADLLQISGNNSSRILQVDSGANASISGLTFTLGNGAASTNSGLGGAITSQSPLTLTDDNFIRNSATQGGAIQGQTALVILRNTFSLNMATGAAGAVANLGTTSITNSTFQGNSTGDYGGAAYLATSGNVLSDNTFIGNSAVEGGALLFNSGSSTGNVGTLTNNVVAGNSATSSYADMEVLGTFTDNGGNLLNLSSATTSTYTAAQLNFAPLAYYGGHLQTLPALPGSVALCAGVNNTSNGYALPATDARSSGFARTSSYGGTTCIDSGAFQAHYSLGLGTAATARLGEPITPNPYVNLLESGTFLSATATTNPVTLTGNPAISGQLTQSAYTAGAWSFNPVLFLATDSPGNGTLTATLPLTASSTATSASIAATAILTLGTDGAPSASASTAVASPATLPVGGTSTVTVTVIDGTTGQPIEGAGVAVAFGSSSAFFTGSSPVTNNAGQATFTLTDATAESVTLTVVVKGVTLNQHPTITFTAAPVFTVTNTTDTTTGVPANCPPGAITGSACSLRDAVAAANATNGSTIIQFAPGIAGTQANPATITLNGTQLELANTNGTQTIAGPGANLLQISGNAKSRVLNIDNNVTANVSSLTFTNGNANGSTGGAIFGGGTLNLSNSTVSNSIAAYGGGVYLFGKATLTSVALLNNTASDAGGGVFAQASLTVVDSLVFGNHGANYGGGIHNSAGSFTLTNSTVTQNSANNGGGVYTTSSTIYTNSIVAGNSGSYDADEYGSYTDNGGNIATGGVGGQSTYTAATLLLAPLGYYGGTTQTMPPLPGSPALCAGVATGTNGTANPTTDQRGKTHSASYCSSGFDSGSVQTSYALAYSIQPRSTSVGSAIAGPPSVLLTESASPFLSPANVSIALNGPGSLATYNSTTTVATSATTGVASFNRLFNDTPSKAETLTATIAAGSGTLGVTSNAYEVLGPAVQLTFTTPPPATLAEGGNPGTLTVTQYDSAGNPSYYTSAGDYEQVTLTVSRNGQTIGTFSSMIGVSDSASFNLSSLSLTTSGTYTYTASATGLTSAVATETVTAGATAQLSVAGFPNPDAVSAPGNVTVTAQDSAGNTMTGFSGTVTITSSDAAATLPGSYTFTAADKGVHTFNVTLNTAGTQAITATTGSGSATITGSEAAILVTGSTWIVNNNGTVSRLNGAGTVLATAGTAGSAGTLGGIAIDSTGDAWAVVNTAAALVKVGPAGTLTGTYVGAGLGAPVAVAIDGLGQVWVANANNSLSAFTNAGVAVSPTTGYGAAAASLPTPFSAPSGIAIDQTGSIWITNSGNSTVTRVFGGAAPVVAPLVTGTTNGTTGTRP